MKDKVVSGGALTMVYSLVDALRLRRETHTFCAFVDIRKAFDTCWVEATLCPPLPGWCDWWDVAHHRELPLWHSFPGSDWTSPIHGWTLVLLKVACSRPCCSISW